MSSMTKKKKITLRKKKINKNINQFYNNRPCHKTKKKYAEL